MAAAKKRAYGQAWGDADYKKAGYERLTLRPREGFLDALDELRARWGGTRTEAVERAVREALEACRRGS